MSSNVTERLARVALGLEGIAISPADFDQARLCMLDWLAVTVAAASSDTAAALQAVIAEEGGAAQATLIGTRLKAGARQAALYNSTLSHVHDYDDVHMAIPGHPTAPVAGAILALAEAQGANGRALLEALIAGIEVTCRIGAGVAPHHYEAGWHASSAIGVIGAAAATARLGGLSEQQTAVALGIAVGLASGVRGAFGAPLKPLQIGHAASSGLLASLLAKRGLGGHANMLERTDGFFETFGRGGFEATALEPQRTLAVQGVLFKKHAACFLTHSAIEAAKRVGEAPSFDLHRIRSITVVGCEDLGAICDRPVVGAALDAKFSVQFVVAAALAGYQTAALSLYDTPPLDDPRILRLMPLIRVRTDARFDKQRSQLHLGLTDGTSVESEVNLAERPADSLADRARVIAKAQSLLAPAYGASRATALIESVLALDERSEVAALMALLAPR